MINMKRDDLIKLIDLWLEECDPLNLSKSCENCPFEHNESMCSVMWEVGTYYKVTGLLNGV